jgi:hypothetical protein
MKAVLLGAAVAAGLLSVSLDYAQAQTAGSVAATCKDGSAFSGDSRRGACRGHGGVKTWNDAGGAPSSAASPTAVTPAAPVTNTAPTTSARPAPLAPAAPAASAGGGAGQVWANSSTKVYHCPGDRYYGKTKHGAYMSEADAKAKGFHGDHGKACS